jgi:hypothetical protein
VALYFGQPGLSKERIIMNQNLNVNLQVVQGDFPIKYGPKTQTHGQSLKKPQDISKLHFKNTMGIPFFYFFKY